MAISFVRAGQLHLQLFFSEAERLFRIHERWLSSEGAIRELGLADDLMESDIIFHTVKRLFADALEQLPCDLFQEDNARTAEWRRKLEVSRAEQRLLSYLRIGDLNFTSLDGGPVMRVEWTVDSRCNSDIPIEIQCHRASQCSHLRDNLLVAGDSAFLHPSTPTSLSLSEARLTYSI
jgi:hypothetical protein